MVYTEIASNKHKTALFLTGFLVLIIGLGWAFSYVTEVPASASLCRHLFGCHEPD